MIESCGGMTDQGSYQSLSDPAKLGTILPICVPVRKYTELDDVLNNIFAIIIGSAIRPVPIMLKKLLFFYC